MSYLKNEIADEWNEWIEVTGNDFCSKKRNREVLGHLTVDGRRILGFSQLIMTAESRDISVGFHRLKNMKSFTAVVGIFCLITTGKLVLMYNYFLFTIPNGWITVLADGELSILHSPKGILFQGNEPLKTSELPLVLSTALGHSLKTVCVI